MNNVPSTFTLSPFHYAFKVTSVQAARFFYCDVLGCQAGRSTEHWIDFNFFGHQLSAHVSAEPVKLDFCGLVDGVKVPIPHFGCLLSAEQFEQTKQRLQAHQVQFIVPPQLRYPGQTGEQSTMFILDNSGNPLEFKSFTRTEEIFT